MGKSTLNIRERLKSIAEQERAPVTGIPTQHPSRLFFHPAPETKSSALAEMRGEEKRQIMNVKANSANVECRSTYGNTLANSANASSSTINNQTKRAISVSLKSTTRRAKDKTKERGGERRVRGKGLPKPHGWLGLRPNDREVYFLLRSLCGPRETEEGIYTPPIGYKTISANTGISMRQTQICVQRLEEAGYLKRIGSNKTHPDLTQRGMVYEVTPKEDKNPLFARFPAIQN